MLLSVFSKNHKGFRGLARSWYSSLLFPHRVPWELHGSLCRGLIRGARLHVQRASRAADSCHRLTGLAVPSLSLSPPPEQTPFAGLISPATSWDLLYGDSFSLRNQEKLRRRQQESSSKPEEAHDHETCLSHQEAPRKLQPRSGAWRKAAAASVAKKTTYSPQKVKTVKPKRTAKRLPKSNVVRPRLPGLRWEGWEGNARGRVKPLRGDDGAHLSKPDPWLWEGGEPPSGLRRRQPAGGTRCVALWRCPPCPVASCHVPRRMVQWHVARHGGPKIRVPRALPLSDAVFTQTTEILASPH